MRVPPQAPALRELLPMLDGMDSEKVAKLLTIKPTDAKERYLHWEQLKYRAAPGGLTVQQHWLGTKMARHAFLKELPLSDKDGVPFKFAVPDVMFKLLHQVDRNASGHIQIAEPIIDIRMGEMYLVRSLVEEAISSSQLEGASTSRKVAKEMLLSQRKPRNHSEQMILNNYHAMQFVREIKDQPLTPEIICHLHQIVTEDTLENPEDAGRIRTSDDIHIFDAVQNRLLYTPPHARELPERLNRLCDFANNKNPQQFVHPVIRAILLHFMLAYDHPFVDGNGRTARALFYWGMATEEYWLIEFISISHIIRMAPAQYGYAFLYAETDENDVTYFIMHQLQVIIRAIEALHTYLANKMHDVIEATALIQNTPLVDKLNHRQTALLEHALKHPGAFYQIREHQNLHKIAYETARSDLLTMADTFGLLVRIKRGRRIIFIAPADLKNRLQALQ